MSDQKRRAYLKKETKERQRIELIQDFTMPNSSSCVKSTPDGRYIFATGLHLVFFFPKSLLEQFIVSSAVYILILVILFLVVCILLMLGFLLISLIIKKYQW